MVFLFFLFSPGCNPFGPKPRSLLYALVVGVYQEVTLYPVSVYGYILSLHGRRAFLKVAM